MDAVLAWWSKQTPFNQFIYKAVLFYAAWFLMFDKDLIGIKNPVNEALTHNTAVVSIATMRAMGQDATNVQKLITREDGSTFMRDYVYISGKPHVIIEDGCNALVLMVLFACFIMAFPGPLKAKLWYIPVGVLAIYLINVVRIILLSDVIQNYSKEVSEWHHKYTFQLSVYIFIFIFWVLWANKFAKNAFETPKGNTPAAA